jgi:hypothetical protein
MSPIELAIGAIELVVALLVAVTCFRRPRLVVPATLGIFFALRGVDRLLVGVLGDEPHTVELAIDFAIAVPLLAVVLIAARPSSSRESGARRRPRRSSPAAGR